MTNRSQTKWFSRSDLVLILILILTGIALTVRIFYPDNKAAACVEVRQNGSILMTLPLDRDTEQIIEDSDGHTNTFQIKDRTVRMVAADCGDKTCINTGGITRTGESIVCLPHRLVLQIVPAEPGNEDTAPDALVR